MCFIIQCVIGQVEPNEFYNTRSFQLALLYMNASQDFDYCEMLQMEKYTFVKAGTAKNLYYNITKYL